MKPRLLFRSKGWTWTLAFALIFPQLFMPGVADAEGSPDLKPAHSSYRLDLTLPDTAAAGDMIDYTVTLATYEMAPATYGNVYFEVDTSGPGHAVYSSPEVPGAGEVSFTDRSEFHKEGFRLPPQYSNTSNWTAVFDQPGEYAVTYKVISQDGTVVAAAVQKVNVTTGQSPYQIEITDLNQAGAGEYLTLPVTISTKVHESGGNKSAFLQVSKTQGDGDIIFTVRDEEGRHHSILNSGDYGKPGFELPAEYDSTKDWRIKFSKIGTYTFSYRLIDSTSGDVLAEDEESVEVVPAYQNLGIQVYNNYVMRAVFGNENGRDVAYMVQVGDPAQLVVVDIQTEETLKAIDLPGATGAWGMAVATDGRVYLGSYGTASLYRYDPSTDTIVNLGDPAEGTASQTTQFFELTPGLDGKIYGGVYPSGSVFEYDPVQGFTNFGNPVPGQIYPRSVAYDKEENILYVGGGGTKNYLIRHDLNTDQKTNIMPAQYNLTSTYDLNIVGDKLFLKMDPGYKMIVLDKGTGAVIKDDELIHSRGVSEPHEGKVYFTYGGILKSYDLSTNEVKEIYTGSEKINFVSNVIGWGAALIDDPNYPGPTLIGVAGNASAKVIKYNLELGTLKQAVMPLPKQPIDLHITGQGPNGKIYAGGFLPGGMGIYDPGTGLSTNNSIGQTEGMTSIGDKMYFGTYPGANIFEYDTTKPWRSSGTNRTVNKLFDLKTEHLQDRPFAMLGAENKLFIGTVPDYGKLGGAFSVYDPATHDLSVHTQIVPNQSIVSLAYKNGKIYAGSSIRGGLGSTPTESEAKLLVWDIAKGVKEKELVPVPGKGAITSLIEGPDGNIWGFAMGTLFIYDPSSGEVVYQDEKFPEAGGQWRDASLLIGKDGLVYGTMSGKLFSIHPEDKKLTIMRNQAAWLSRDHMGNLYFVTGNELWRHVIEDNKAAVTEVRLNVSTLELSVDQTAEIKAEVQPSFATVKNVSWTSSNSAVASVSAVGVVKGLQPGTAVINVTTLDGSKTAECVVTVK